MLQGFIESHDARNGFSLKPQRTKVEHTLENEVLKKKSHLRVFGHQLWGEHIKFSFLVIGLNLFENRGEEMRTVFFGE